MIIDDVTISVSAGNGGRGAVAFNKNLMSLGPAGGTGGKGGSVFIEGASDLSLLKQFRYKKSMGAENGGPGKGQFCDGTDGSDLTIKVPVGTIVQNITTGESFDVLQIGERILIARGGIGGKGNFHFRSSRNTTPKQFQPGIPGEKFTVRLELKMIADVGLIGLPNAGKSSLLNIVTNAKSKVADYPFTTLEPNLGVYYGLILADIPGLIEGASNGKGLGTKFLRHIERTKVLFHLVSAESEDPVRDYETLRNELRLHNPELLTKQEYVFLSKADMVTGGQLEERLEKLRDRAWNAIPLSSIDDRLLNDVKQILNKLESEKKWSGDSGKNL